jgi:hydrogenase maturation protease
MARVLIIGFGNPLRGDDGFGWHAARTISAQIHSPDVQVIASHQLTPELAEDISQAERVLFIDVARDLPQGEVRCEAIASMGAQKLASPLSYSHHLSPSTLLDVCGELYGSTPPAFLVSVGGEEFSPRDCLSKTVSEILDDVISVVQKFISTGECNVP